MTLTEYLNQGDWPVRCPHVVLQDGEYDIGQFMGGYKHMYAQVFIKGIEYEYAVKEGSTTLWTVDGDGNPRSVSVFNLPDDFFTKLKSNDAEKRLA